MSAPDDINDADWWKNRKPAPASGPARAEDAGPFRILFIAGPYSGRRIDVDKLSEGELIRLGDTGEFLYYVQDKPHSRNYYFHKAMTEYFNTHRAAAEKMFGPRVTPKEFQ